MDFVSRYLPAYHAYLPTLYKEGPNGSKPEQLLVIDIDEGRNPLWGSWGCEFLMYMLKSENGFFSDSTEQLGISALYETSYVKQAL